MGNAELQIINGVNKVAHKLASVQTDQGYNVTLWGISKTLNNDYFSRNYKTQLFLKKSNPFDLDPEFYRAISSLNKNDIVHFHGSFIPAFYLIAKELQNNNIPYVYTSHGDLSPGAMKYQKWWKIPYFYCLEKQILNNARGVHVLGESVKSNLKKLGVSSPMFLIPNGQELNEVAQFERKITDQFTVGFCGKIEIRNKGLDLAIEGFSRFLKSGGRGKFELIGDGTDLTRLKQMVANKNLSQHIVFHGSNYGTEKFKLLAQIDVFIRSSRMDGFPVTVLEACSLGIPCIVSEPTNTFDYIEKYDAGFLLHQNSAEDIKNALDEAYRLSLSGNLFKKGLNARRMITNSFSWKKVSNKILEVYQKDKSEIETRNQGEKVLF